MTTRSESKGVIAYGSGGYSRQSSGTDGKTETVDGVVRDKWNNYSFYIIRGKQSLSYYAGSPRYQYSLNTLPPYPFNNNDINKGLSKLSEKIKGHDFNLAVNAAQIGQVTDMVVDTLRTFRNTMKYIRRGDIANAARQLGTGPRRNRFRSKSISGRWLELQYGWLPLCSDVFEASKAIEAANSVRTKRFRASIRRGADFNASQGPGTYSGIGRNQGILSYTTELLEIPSAARNLGLLDPATVAWEVIPFSFVVDWFIPIGTYIENLSYIPFLSGRSMTTKFAKFSASAKNVVDFGPLFKAGSCTIETVRMDRIVGGLTVPRPQFNPFDLAFSGKRIYNAAALTHLAFSRR